MLKKATQALALVFLAAGALSAQNATLDEVLQCHYDAIGGLEAWENVDAVRMSGHMSMGPGMQAPFTVLNARPNKMRVEFTVQGMTGIQGYDGETAWQIMPFMGSTEPEEMPAEQAESLESDSDLDGPLIGYEEAGIELELLEPTEVDGTPANRILVTRPDGQEHTYFLDAEYCVPIRVETEREMQGQTIQVTTVMGDYKEVDGLMVAHSIETSTPVSPASQVMTIETVEVNPEYDPATFTMPAGEDGGTP